MNPILLAGPSSTLNLDNTIDLIAELDDYSVEFGHDLERSLEILKVETFTNDTLLWFSRGSYFSVKDFMLSLWLDCGGITIYKPLCYY